MVPVGGFGVVRIVGVAEFGLGGFTVTGSAAQPLLTDWLSASPLYDAVQCQIPGSLAVNVLLVAQRVRKLVGSIVQLLWLFRLTTCDPKGFPAHVGSVGAKSVNVTVPLGGSSLSLGTKPARVAVSERLTGGTPGVSSLPPGPGVVLIEGNEISAEPMPLPGPPFIASVALALARTAVWMPLREGSASLVAILFTLKVKLIVQIPLTGS
jgi:hypothetical protein